ncbi:Tetratricopeptide repeat [Porites harrisoni]
MSEHRRQVFAEVYERAKVLQAKKCHDGAIKELNKLIELAEKIKNEDDLPKVLIARAWNDRGHLKYLQVDFYGAVADFSQAILLDNEFAVPFYNRGQIHYRMGRYKDAVEDLREAIRIDPSFEDAKIYLHQAIQDWNNTLAN